MSLINEALKKAQRQRTEEPRSAVPYSDHANGPIPKRAAPMRAQSLVLLVAAAAALIVLSVVFTVFFVSRKPAEALPSVSVAVAKPTTVDLKAPSPAIVAPVIAPPPRATEPAAEASAAPAYVEAVSAPVTPANVEPATTASVVEPKPVSVASIPQSSPATAAHAATPTPAPKRNALPDPRILNFVDAIRVTGIRSSGTESKVLMNDRVFRVNELVERTLGVKLVKVHSDSLTFEDTNGVIYTKNF